MSAASPPAVIRILSKRDMDSVEVYAAARGAVAAFTVTNPVKDRGDNQDAAAVIPVDEARAVLAVADGVGGQRQGAEAAQLALQTMIECVAGSRGEESLRSAVMDGIERANAAVADLGVGAATTLAAVEIDEATMRPYHVGDSMILAAGQRGRIKLQTVSHSPVGYAVEAGLLDERDAIHHEDRHLVSNFVGSAEMRIEVGRTLHLRPLDTVVLGSDGLFDNLHIAEIVDLVRTGPLAKAAGKLAEACRRRMCLPEPGHPSKPDDLTFLIYRCRA